MKWKKMCQPEKDNYSQRLIAGGQRSIAAVTRNAGCLLNFNFGSRFFLYNKVLEKTIENPMGFRVE